MYTLFGETLSGRYYYSGGGLLLLAAGLHLYLYLTSAGRTPVDYYFCRCSASLPVLTRCRGIQREYAAREARRGKIWFYGVIFSFLLGNTKGIRGARSAPRENRGFRESVSFHFFRKYKGITKGIRGARIAPRKNLFLGVGLLIV